MTISRGVSVTLAVVVAAAISAGCSFTDEQPVAGAGKPAAKVKSTVPRRKGDERPDAYVVRSGDTLFGIALDFGLDYRELARWNGLQDPDRILVGRQLRLIPPSGDAVEPATVKPLGKGQEAVVESLGHAGESPAPSSRTLPDGRQIPILSEPAALTVDYSDAEWSRLGGAPLAGLNDKAVAAASAGRRDKDKPAKPPEKDNAPDDDAIEWAWPTKGDVLYRFGEPGRPKGIGIGGKAGQPVQAAADGKVVYSGTGLRGYGKLVIIKHNETYLSVYAHNQSVLVKEGDLAKRGQKIAEMGDTDATRVALHFEVRRFGQPVDPLTRIGSPR
ncbi:MAG: peptidoglycan DD-metalloendopeptidase family protein [Burkholderiales bacterium]